MPEPQGSHLRRAASDLGQLDVRARQIAEGGLRATAMEKQRFLFVALLMLSLPVGLLGAIAVAQTAKSAPFDGDRLEGLVPFIGSAIVAVAAVLFIVRWMEGQRRQRAEDSFAADPPRVPGASATCHVCGAPLPAARAEDKGVARCTYCKADNVVDPGVMARMAGRRRLVLDDFAAHIGRHARGYSEQVSGVGFAMMVYFFPIWIGSMVALIYATPWIGSRIGTLGERATNGETEYLIVDLPNASKCVVESNGKGKLRGSPTGGKWQAFAESADQPTFRADALVGEYASSKNGETSYGMPLNLDGSGDVLRVYADADGVNWAVFARKDAERETHSHVSDLCLVVTPKKLAIFKPD